MTALRQGPRQFPVAAAQIQDILLPAQGIEHAPDSGLNPLPRGREGIAEAGIKLAVEGEEALGSG